jgi:hypothetical protein
VQAIVVDDLHKSYGGVDAVVAVRRFPWEPRVT